MINWREVKLGDICDLIAGFAFKSKDFGNYPNKVIKITNIEPPFVNMANLIGIDISKYNRDKLKKFSATKGDYVLAMTGATIGKLGRICEGEAYINQRVLMFKPTEAIDKKFLYYNLVDNNFMQYVLNHIDSESAQANISATTIGKYEFSIPSPGIQKQIAGVLGALDDKIELNNKINNNLEQQAQALFKLWFVDFEPFGGKMPDDWKVGTLDDLVSFINGYAFKSSDLENSPEKGKEYYDVFKQGHIKRGGGFNQEGTKSYYLKDNATNLDKYILKKGDILMAMTDMKGNVAILGNTALMNVNNRYIVNQRVGLLRCINNYNISYPYIYLLTNSSDFLTDLRNRANSGVQVNLSSTEIKVSEVIIPDRETNYKFDQVGKAIFEKIFYNQQENTRLAQLRDTLLPKLMSGEIDVSNVNISTDKSSFSGE